MYIKRNYTVEWLLNPILCHGELPVQSEHVQLPVLNVQHHTPWSSCLWPQMNIAQKIPLHIRQAQPGVLAVGHTHVAHRVHHKTSWIKQLSWTWYPPPSCWRPPAVHTSKARPPWHCIRRKYWEEGEAESIWWKKEVLLIKSTRYAHNPIYTYNPKI